MQPSNNYHGHQPKPYTSRPPDTILAEASIIIERKRYLISRRENVRGAFLVITEERAPHPDNFNRAPFRNKVIVPLAGLSDFTLAIQKVCGL
jgi:hypothetical protein